MHLPLPLLIFARLGWKRGAGPHPRSLGHRGVGLGGVSAADLTGSWARYHGGFERGGYKVFNSESKHEWALGRMWKLTAKISRRCCRSWWRWTGILPWGLAVAAWVVRQKGPPLVGSGSRGHFPADGAERGENRLLLLAC